MAGEFDGLQVVAEVELATLDEAIDDALLLKRHAGRPDAAALAEELGIHVEDVAAALVQRALRDSDRPAAA